MPSTASLLNAAQVSVIPQPPQPAPHHPSNSPPVIRTSPPVCSAASTQMPRVSHQVPGPRQAARERSSIKLYSCVCVHARTRLYEVVYEALYVEFCMWPEAEYIVSLTNQHLSHANVELVSETS